MSQHPTIGRIVHYRPVYDASLPVVGGDFHVAALVTMTPEEWTPGFRGADGEWHETTNVEQPRAGTVHLHIFGPPIVAGGTPYTVVDFSHVPMGAGPGTWSWPPRV